MTDWREGYYAALKQFILENGSPMEMEDSRYSDLYGPTPNYYGWQDYRAREHFRGKNACTAVVHEDATVTEERYQQFKDTYYEDDDHESFVVVHPVSCICGEYTDQYWAYESSTGNLITSLLK